MNRYIVVNTKKKGSAVWETIGDNYTPSNGEVCIIVPPTDKIDTTRELLNNTDNKLLLTTAEKQEVVYIITKKGYDLNDSIDQNTKILRESLENRNAIVVKIENLESELGEENINYIKKLIYNGSVSDKETISDEARETLLTKLANTETITPNANNAIVYTTDDGNGNLTLHTEIANRTKVAPISIKIGNGTTCFRELPTLTSGNVQGDWTTADPTDPSYIHNKPIMNDDLFQQSEEKILLIPASSLYDNENNLVIKGLLDLFNFTYNDNFDNATSMILTTAEKQAVIYIVNADGYDIKDLTNVNTKILTASESNRTIIANKIEQLKLNNIISDVELSQSDIDYLKELIQKGTTTKTRSTDLVENLNKIVPAEDIRPNVSITVKDLSYQKIFHGEEYIKISGHYFHPNDLLIYKDNNWGYYEIHMFGDVAPFYDDEILFIKQLALLDKPLEDYPTSDYITYITQKIKSFITDAECRNFLLSKISLFNEKNITLEQINSQLPSESVSTKLAQLLVERTITNLEINKQPRYWFYKSNILKIKEKESLSQEVRDALYVYNNRFNAEEQAILLQIAEGLELTSNQQYRLQNGLREKLINKININIDITVNNGKNFLKERLSTNFERDENGAIIYTYTLTADEQAQLVKQIQISKNSLSDTLGETEINDITEEVLSALIEQINTEKNNSIQEKYEDDLLYYEINNEIILDTTDRAIYMRLKSLIGYLKYCKNLEIIFHYKDRSINSAFLSDINSNWDENNAEQPSFIANRIVYKNNNGVIKYETWFYEWLYSVIQTAVQNWFDKNVEGRLQAIEERLTELENNYKTLKERLDELEQASGDNITKLLARLNSVIVSQPTQPILTETFFPKIWICTDNKSGYGLVYWRSGGENEKGGYDESLASTVKWTPISAIWSPDSNS